ncbi:MAG: futalosine hydrolase [Nitrospirae bacterium]|nr:futalosine hydrolase [Nitrospirota bacterium]
MKFLALLSSVPFESDGILSCLKNIRRGKIAGKAFYKGKLSGHNVLLMNTGIGKVNAAHSATALIEHFQIRHIINFGVGGAYPESGLARGDVAIATKEIYGDEGVISSGGWSDMKAIGIPVVQRGKEKYFNEIPIDKSPLIKSGNFVTVSSVTGTLKRALELEKKFHAICENMEGAAIAHVCVMYKIPLLEIRGISNIAGLRDKRKWNLKLASENCQEAVLEIIARICFTKACMSEKL